MKVVGKRCHFWSLLTFSRYSTGESSMITKFISWRSCQKFSVLVWQYQFLHRDSSEKSGNFPGYFRGNSQKSLGNFPDTPPPPDAPPTLSIPPPIFQMVFLEMSKVIKSEIFYQDDLHCTPFMYKTVSFCAQGSREARKFLRYLGIKLSKPVQNSTHFE